MNDNSSSLCRRYTAAVLVLGSMLCGCTARPQESPEKNTSSASLPSVSISATPETAPSPALTTISESTTVPLTAEPLTPAGLDATVVCTLKGLPISKAVQQFVYVREGDALTVFTAQRDGQTTYLTRCPVSEDGKSAAAADYIRLEGYGHAESLDASTRDGVVYLYLGSGANSLTSSAWATTITRLRYDAGSVSDVKTITGIECAGKTGSPLGPGYTPYRVNFALDNQADILALYLRLDTNRNGKQVGHYLVTYRLSAIDAMLDAAESGISLADADATDAWLASSGKKTLEDFCHNGSFQGLEIDAEENIYIVGGSAEIRPQLSRFAFEDGVFRRKKVTSINRLTSALLGDRNFAAEAAYIEIESIKAFEGKLYCSFNPTGSAIPNGTQIFLLEEK